MASKKNHYQQSQADKAKAVEAKEKKKAAEAAEAEAKQAAEKAAEENKTPEQLKEEKAKLKAKLKAQKKLQRKSRVSRVGLIIAVAIGCAAMVLSVCGIACSGIVNNNNSEYHLTGGVAATVNGENLTEDTITKQIMSTRTSGGYKKDKKWAQYLVDQGLTPKSLRKQIIDSYTQQMLIEQAESEYKIKVTNDDVEKAWKDACKSAGGEKAFESQLKMYGYTEDTYKSSLQSSLAQQKLKKKVAPSTKPTDKEIVKYLNENIKTYNDARRSSQILIKVDSKASDKDKAKAKEKARECLDKINSGELTFEKAVKKYSDDTASAAEKGDVGWDKLTSFVQEYQTALSNLNDGQMSGLVESQYGYHIIKCTGYFHVDDKVTDINQVPAAMKQYVSNVIKTQSESTKYSKWLAKYTKKAKIKVNKMPSDVPYNVSLKGITKSKTANNQTPTVQ